MYSEKDWLLATRVIKYVGICACKKTQHTQALRAKKGNFLWRKTAMQFPWKFLHRIGHSRAESRVCSTYEALPSDAKMPFKDDVKQELWNHLFPDILFEAAATFPTARRYHSTGGILKRAINSVWDVPRRCNGCRGKTCNTVSPSEFPIPVYTNLVVSLADFLFSRLRTRLWNSFPFSKIFQMSRDDWGIKETNQTMMYLAWNCEWNS